MTTSERSGDRLVSLRDKPFGGWVPIDEFENLFASLSGAAVLTARARVELPGLLGRARNRLLSHVSLDGDAGRGDLLLVVARSPVDLRALVAVSGWRKRFRMVVGYVIDAFFLDSYPAATRHFDHVFTTTQDGADHVRTKYGVPSSVLRLGFDCLQWASTNEERSIDLLGYGRQPPSFHHGFQQAFHRHDSPVLYLHSQIGATSGPAVWTERPMMLKLMQRSKVSLAFHMLVEPTGQRPAHMFVTPRWLESLAAGCVVAGRRPVGEMADAMLNWPQATIELPDAGVPASERIVELVSQPALLRPMRQRNVLEMCRQHDWRYRIRDILKGAGLSIPMQLASELQLLDQKCQRLALLADGHQPACAIPKVPG